MLKRNFRIYLNVSVFLPTTDKIVAWCKTNQCQVLVIMNLKALKQLQSQNVCCKNRLSQDHWNTCNDKITHRCQTPIWNNYGGNALKSNPDLTKLTFFKYNDIRSGYSGSFFFLPERASSDTGGKDRLCTVICLFNLNTFQQDICF
jgi:hypothetical protein